MFCWIGVTGPGLMDSSTESLFETSKKNDRLHRSYANRGDHQFMEASCNALVRHLPGAVSKGERDVAIGTYEGRGGRRGGARFSRKTRLPPRQFDRSFLVRSILVEISYLKPHHPLCRWSGGHLREVQQVRLAEAIRPAGSAFAPSLPINSSLLRNLARSSRGLRALPTFPRPVVT